MKNKCPHCSFGRTYKLGDGRLKCRSCHHRFKPFVSVWHHYRITESEKRKLLEYFVLGVPVYRARFRITCARDTAERFFRDIRRVLALHEHLQEPLQGELEMDESPFGGRRKGKRGWGAAGKMLVFGIIKRNGRVRLSIVPNRRYKTLRREIEEHTRPGSLYYTDDYEAYASVALRGERVVVKKTKGRPKGRDHINGIEGFWSYAKNWLYQYRGVHRKFFHLYLGEISYRFNHRDQDLLPLIHSLLLETRYTDIKDI